jgi:hypothetical protein
MARRNGTTIGLESAMALLVQNQAKCASDMVDINRRYNELKEKIDTRLTNIENLLARHDQLLKNLPDAIKEKIGFKKP